MSAFHADRSNYTHPYSQCDALIHIIFPSRKWCYCVYVSERERASIRWHESEHNGLIEEKNILISHQNMGLSYRTTSILCRSRSLSFMSISSIPIQTRYTVCCLHGQKTTTTTIIMLSITKLRANSHHTDEEMSAKIRKKNRYHTHTHTDNRENTRKNTNKREIAYGHNALCVLFVDCECALAHLPGYKCDSYILRLCQRIQRKYRGSNTLFNIILLHYVASRRGYLIVIIIRQRLIRIADDTKFPIFGWLAFSTHNKKW